MADAGRPCEAADVERSGLTYRQLLGWADSDYGPEVAVDALDVALRGLVVTSADLAYSINVLAESVERDPLVVLAEASMLARLNDFVIDVEVTATVFGDLASATPDGAMLKYASDSLRRVLKEHGFENA